ncbi:MAG: CspA family cold shock protein [Halioglobus sp.]|jgi:CspA family cold shock protein
MSLFGKLVISLLVAAIASAATTFAGSHGAFFTVFCAFAAATIATSLLGSIKAPGAATSAATGSARNAKPKSTKPKPQKADKSSKPKSTGGKREDGEVKWFNVSKGFGFISRENGEEIFVHFRSILGEGRRSLRDGQKVSFVVADSDKGLQAEDVEPVD